MNLSIKKIDFVIFIASLAGKLTSSLGKKCIWFSQIKEVLRKS